MLIKDYEQQIKTIIGDAKIRNKPLILGTPSKALIACGAHQNQNITITYKVIKKSMMPEIRNEEGKLTGNTGHELTEEMLIKAIAELEKPTMIFRGGDESSLIVVTDLLDKKSRNIIIALRLDREEAFSLVTSIRSIYGRDNFPFFVEKNMNEGNLMAVKKEKADEMLRSIGKWYPKENTFISL